MACPFRGGDSYRMSWAGDCSPQNVVLPRASEYGVIWKWDHWFRWGYAGVGWPLIQHEWCPCKKRWGENHGKVGGDGGRDWSAVSTSQGRPQFSSVAQSCPTLCDPMDCSMPGFPVHHQLPELAQTHVHRVGDVIQPSHPLLSPSPPAFSLSQQWVSSLYQVAKLLEFQLQHQSFQRIFRTDFL